MAFSFPGIRKASVRCSSLPSGNVLVLFSSCIAVEVVRGSAPCANGSVQSSILVRERNYISRTIQRSVNSKCEHGFDREPALE